MKSLKFKPELCKQIVAGSKTATWRLFDDKDLTVGDKIKFINKDTLEAFGTGEITRLTTRTLSTLTEDDWKGHERFTSEVEMYATYRSYYGNAVDENTEVKLITFTFQAK